MNKTKDIKKTDKIMTIVGRNLRGVEKSLEVVVSHEPDKEGWVCLAGPYVLSRLSDQRWLYNLLMDLGCGAQTKVCQNINKQGEVSVWRAREECRLIDDVKKEAWRGGSV